MSKLDVDEEWSELSAPEPPSPPEPVLTNGEMELAWSVAAGEDTPCWALQKTKDGRVYLWEGSSSRSTGGITGTYLIKLLWSWPGHPAPARVGQWVVFPTIQVCHTPEAAWWMLDRVLSPLYDAEKKRLKELEDAAERACQTWLAEKRGSEAFFTEALRQMPPGVKDPTQR